MNVEEAKACLHAGGFQVNSEDRLPNGTGTKITASNGAIINVYDSGKVVVQGKNQVPVKECLGVQTAIAPVSYTHLRAHETPEHLVCRLLLEKKK